MDRDSEHRKPATRVPEDPRALGTVALGGRAPAAPGRSRDRPRPPLDDIVHRGFWQRARSDARLDG